jgi:hypothetical protein
MPSVSESVSLVKSICADMPSMRDCKRCNKNYAAADCSVVDVYMSLCNVHWMSQCQKHKNVCSAAKGEKVTLTKTCDYYNSA